VPRLRRSRPPLPRFAVAWFPAFAGMEKIEQFRREHDPVADRIAAHVSLVFPFPTQLTALQVETHVRRIVSKWPPIPVTFRRVRTEANEFVFLMVSRGRASIVALHDRLYTRSLAAHLRRDLSYEPHITIARHADFATLEAAHEEASDLFRGEFAGVIREASLLAVAPDGRIEALQTFGLYTQ